MPLTPTLHITLPEDDNDDGLGEYRHFAPILLALEAMISVNLYHIRRALRKTEKGLGVPIPPILESGVYYEEDPPGTEDWRDCYTVLARGKGDCDNVVAWRIAELRAAGINAKPIIKWQKVPKEMMISLGHPAHMVPDEGVDMVHVMVELPDGRIEDTSKLLGMGGAYTNKV